MTSVAGQSPITVYTPHVLAGASESDAARFLYLCDLARRRFRKQPGKESLEQVAQMPDSGMTSTTLGPSHGSRRLLTRSFSPGKS